MEAFGLGLLDGGHAALHGRVVPFDRRRRRRARRQDVLDDGLRDAGLVGHVGIEVVVVGGDDPRRVGALVVLQRGGPTVPRIADGNDHVDPRGLELLSDGLVVGDLSRGVGVGHGVDRGLDHVDLELLEGRADQARLAGVGRRRDHADLLAGEGTLLLEDGHLLGDQVAVGDLVVVPGGLGRGRLLRRQRIPDDGRGCGSVR